jgi:hypothetical protein
MDPAKLGAFIRDVADKLNGQIQRTGLLDRQVADVKAIVDRLTGESTKHTAQIESVRQIAGMHPFANRLEAEVAKDFPDWGFYALVESAAVTAASTADIPINMQISSGTWFFAKRIYVSWRPTAGGWANHWAPIGSSNPALAALAAPQANVLDFMWQYSDTWSSRRRQNVPIPGDVLYRSDRDGFIPGSDGWPPDTTVSFIFTPTANPAQDGRLWVTILGVQYMKGLPARRG